MKLPKLVFVTGKGGVGKTTVTHLLGRQSQAAGARTAVVEINGEGLLSRGFGVDPRVFGPTPIADGLDLFALDALDCLHDFGKQKLRSKWLVQALLGHRIVETLIDGVPGFHDLFQLGKIHHMATDNGSSDPYDRVIIDCPSTGHASTLFSAASGIRDMTRVGLVYDEAKVIAETLADPSQAATIVVTFPEALPIQETISFVSSRAPEHPHIGGLVVNRCLPDPSLSDIEWNNIQRAVADLDNPELVHVAHIWQNTLNAQRHHLAKLRGDLPVDLPLATVNESSSLEGMQLLEVPR